MSNAHPNPVPGGVEERLAAAIGTVQQFARIDCCEDGLVVFDLVELKPLGWFTLDDWRLDEPRRRLAVVVPFGHDDQDHLRNLCAVHVRHALELRIVELEHYKQWWEKHEVDVDVDELLTAAREYLALFTQPHGVTR